MKGKNKGFWSSLPIACIERAKYCKVFYVTGICSWCSLNEWFWNPTGFFVRFGRNSFPPKWLNSFPKRWNSFPKLQNSFPRTQKVTFLVIFTDFCIIYIKHWDKTCRKVIILVKFQIEKAETHFQSIIFHFQQAKNSFPKGQNSFPKGPKLISAGFHSSVLGLIAHKKKPALLYLNLRFSGFVYDTFLWIKIAFSTGLFFGK